MYLEKNTIDVFGKRIIWEKNDVFGTRNQCLWIISCMYLGKETNVFVKIGNECDWKRNGCLWGKKRVNLGKYGINYGKGRSIFGREINAFWKENKCISGKEIVYLGRRMNGDAFRKKRTDVITKK